MTLGLRTLSFLMRAIEKPRLARLKGPEGMRAGLERAAKLLPGAPASVRFWRETLGDDARPALWCAPRAYQPGAAEARRLVLYFHGGAYVAGSPDSHRSILWPLALATGAPVAAVDYRLAPEHPFPAAYDDARRATAAALDWCRAPERLALAGDSAGGGLAAAVIGGLAADRGPRLGAAALFSPFADLALRSPSLERLKRREALLPVERIPEVVARVLAGADPEDPRASPVYARFAAPPPVLIQVGAQEALRDDSFRLADALRAAGGDVRVEVWRHAPHGFQFFAPALREARRALDAAGAFLRERLEAAAPSP